MNLLHSMDNEQIGLGRLYVKVRKRSGSLGSVRLSAYSPVRQKFKERDCVFFIFRTQVWHIQ